MAKAMKWGKWPCCIIMFMAAIMIIVIGPGASAPNIISKFFGWYFMLIFAFVLISGGFLTFYFALINEKFLTSYPKQYPNLRWGHSPYNAWLLLKSGMKIDDDALNQLCRRGLFWLISMLTIFITAPVGAVVFLLLMQSKT